MVFFGLLALPFAIGGLGYFVLRRTITWKEYLLYTAISIVIAVAGYAYSTYRAIRDTETLGGRIAEKVREETPCCHCRSVCSRRGKRLKCERWRNECDHVRDHRYALEIDVGTSHEVVLATCESNDAPPGWEAVRVGDPAAVERNYLNFLAADEHSLLSSGEIAPEYFDRIPRYPRVRDGYRVDRVVEAGASAPPAWAAAMDEVAASLGAKKQVDPRIVVTDVDDPRFADAVEAKWNYGPKNAVIVVVGVGGSEVRWARVVTMSRVSALQVAVREELPGMPLAGAAVPERIGTLIDAHFERLPMSELRYLLGAAHPGTAVTLALYGLELLVIGLLVWVAHRTDPFGDAPRTLRQRFKSRAAQLTWIALAWRVGRAVKRRLAR